MAQKNYIVGNWKMHQNQEQVRQFFKELSSPNLDFWIAPQAIHIPMLLSLKSNYPGLKVGAQNCAFKSEGALTGEISPNGLKDLGVDFVLIGHSERRQSFGERDQALLEKAKLAQSQGLAVIYCIGETLEEREQGKTISVLESQLAGPLKENLHRAGKEGSFIIAYEPVWAIGTGKVATVEEIAKAHQNIQSWVGPQVPILYGGSVKPANIESILKVEAVWGALIGGASLKAEDMNKICLVAGQNSC